MAKGKWIACHKYHFSDKNKAYTFPLKEEERKIKKKTYTHTTFIVMVKPLKMISISCERFVQNFREISKTKPQKRGKKTNKMK